VQIFYTPGVITPVIEKKISGAKALEEVYFFYPRSEGRGY